RALLTLQEVFADTNIEELPIKYTAVATDLAHEDEVIFRTGSVYEAIRASIAIPAIFRAVDSENRFLVDGGLLNPVPVNHVQVKENIVVAVNLDGASAACGGRSFSKLSALDILQESYVIMRRRLCTLTVALYKPDYIIDIPHDLCGIWEFDRAMELLQKGYDIASAYLAEADLVKRVTS
ncbi:MAG TPA: patatin-like phospholipase family protein, partial [Sphingobacterium sp.]|nr:patatin-like phospholipase family protein [Sphingobacterium sp.]